MDFLHQRTANLLHDPGHVFEDWDVFLASLLQEGWSTLISLALFSGCNFSVIAVAWAAKFWCHREILFLRSSVRFTVAPWVTMGLAGVRSLTTDKVSLLHGLLGSLRCLGLLSCFRVCIPDKSSWLGGCSGVPLLLLSVPGDSGYWGLRQLQDMVLPRRTLLSSSVPGLHHSAVLPGVRRQSCFSGSLGWHPTSRPGWGSAAWLPGQGRLELGYSGWGSTPSSFPGCWGTWHLKIQNEGPVVTLFIFGEQGQLSL